MASRHSRNVSGGVYQSAGGKKRTFTFTGVASSSVHVFVLGKWAAKVFLQGVVQQTSRDSTRNKNSESKAVFIFHVK